VINRRKRRDANHKPIVEALKACGWAILDTSQCGDGAPDLIIARAGRVIAVEVKAPKGTLKPGQVAWLAAWPGEHAVIRSIADVLAVTQETG
jgi:Holliday junction resolvase